MARKPNYRFERHERERVQAEKRAARLALKEQRKTDGDGEPGATPAADPAAATGSNAQPSGSPAEAEALAAQKDAVIAAMKPIETMTPEEIATLHENARRLAASGNAKQRAVAAELLPRIEAELRRLDEAKKQAAAARLAGATRRANKQ
jgi:hypothetical protein